MMNAEIHEVEEQEPWYKGPIKWILAFFVVGLVILWLIPYSAVRLDPEPQNIPKLNEIVPLTNEQVTINRTFVGMQDYPNLVLSNDPFIKQVADKIVTASCESSIICHAKALFYFVRDNFQYVSDPLAHDYVKTAKESLLSQGGDCDDASVLLANLEEAVGITTRFVFIPEHVYIQIYLPEAASKYKDKDGWINLDATCTYCKFGEIPFQNINKKKTII